MLHGSFVSIHGCYETACISTGARCACIAAYCRRIVETTQGYPLLRPPLTVSTDFVFKFVICDLCLRVTVVPSSHACFTLYFARCLQKKKTYAVAVTVTHSIVDLRTVLKNVNNTAFERIFQKLIIPRRFSAASTGPSITGTTCSRRERSEKRLGNPETITSLIERFPPNDLPVRMVNIATNTNQKFPRKEKNNARCSDIRQTTVGTRSSRTERDSLYEQKKKQPP